MGASSTLLDNFIHIAPKTIFITRLTLVSVALWAFARDPPRTNFWKGKAVMKNSLYGTDTNVSRLFHLGSNWAARIVFNGLF